MINPLDQGLPTFLFKYHFPFYDYIKWLLLAFLGCVTSDSSSLFGEITSPNYPQGYPNNAKQSWDVQVPEGYGIRLYFIHLDIEPSDGCEYDFLQVIIGDVAQDTLCGHGLAEAPGKPVNERYYHTTRLKLLFTSDFSNQERYTGFAAYYVAVDINECEDYSLNPCSHFCNNYIGGYFCSCPPEYDLQEDHHTCGVNCSGGLHTELRGQISSPGYPSPYPENSRCEYKVLLEQGYQVIINFLPTDFDIEVANDGTCSYDSLTIKAKGQTFGPYCGKKPPLRIETHSNEVDIIFQTDSGGDNKGWKMRYSWDSVACPNQVTEHAILDPLQGKYIFKDTVTVRCKEGYEILVREKKQLSFLTKCQGDGTWSNSHLRCQRVYGAVDCGDPEEIDYGQVMFSTTTFKSEAKYSCKSEYYTLNGEETYYCSFNGIWVNSKGQSELPKCNPEQYLETKEQQGESRTAVKHNTAYLFGLQGSDPYPFLITKFCGKSKLLSTSRIYGGQKAGDGYFPWVVRINSPSLGGGALISDRWVLTAAHVVQFSNEVRMRAGNVALSSTKKLKGKKVYLHPGWTVEDAGSRTSFDNDIALVLLNQRVEMGPCVCLACLPEEGEKNSPALQELGYVAGWGKTDDSHDESRTPILQYVSIPVRKTEDCKTMMETNQAFTENMMCAGGYGADSCKGDSGGPLMFNDVSDENNGKRLYVGGIVSWGVKCGAFGMYTKVKNYLGWIKETIQRVEEEERNQKVETIYLVMYSNMFKCYFDIKFSCGELISWLTPGVQATVNAKLIQETGMKFINSTDEAFNAAKEELRGLRLTTIQNRYALDMMLHPKEAIMMLTYTPVATQDVKDQEELIC
ncbi:complement C1s subcomponent-like [Gastrophryne carolinensis]